MRRGFSGGCRDPNRSAGLWAAQISATGCILRCLQVYDHIFGLTDNYLFYLGVVGPFGALYLRIPFDAVKHTEHTAIVSCW